MSSDQLDLSLPTNKPEVNQSDIDLVIGILTGRGWMTSSQLLSFSSLEGFNKRDLRAIAEYSEGQIISGQKGYRLTLESTPDEINEFAWLNHAADRMKERYTRTLRVWHSRRKPI